MLYYLHELGAHWGLLNVFQYVTFRSAAAGLSAFLLCLLFGGWVIRRLISLKVGQPIRTQEEVHKLAELHGGKRGTPTMGGIMLLAAVIVATLLWARPDSVAYLSIALAGRIDGLDFPEARESLTKLGVTMPTTPVSKASGILG